MSINRNWRGTKTERNETIAKEGSRQAASSSSTPGLETELARGPLRRARETPVDNPRTPSAFLPPVYRNPLLCPTIVDVATALRLPCILDSRRPRSRPPFPILAVVSAFSSVPPPCIPRELGQALRGWTRAGRWSLNQVYNDWRLRRAGCAAAKPPLHDCVLTPPSFRPRSSLVRSARGCNPLHSIATAQLLDGSPGEATNLCEPGRYVRRGEDRTVAGERGEGGREGVQGAEGDGSVQRSRRVRAPVD